MNHSWRNIAICRGRETIKRTFQPKHSPSITYTQKRRHCFALVSRQLAFKLFEFVDDRKLMGKRFSKFYCGCLIVTPTPLNCRSKSQLFYEIRMTLEQRSVLLCRKILCPTSEYAYTKISIRLVLELI